MGFLDLAGELLRQIDFEKSEIIHLQKLVFLCGGKASGVVEAPRSLRELLLHRVDEGGTPDKLGDAAVLLAEEAERALAKSNFGNLLDLEEYIAAVVHAVVLIVESPGSFCELGAFVKTPEIREKLIVVLPSKYKNEPSFITNGAIKYLEGNYAEAQILGFHWNVDEQGIVSAPDYALDVMKTDIPAAIQEVRKTHAKEAFNANKKGHLIYLTLAFCHLLRAAKFGEIKQCFQETGIDIDESTIKRCIDTLTICKLLKVVENGRLAFYVASIPRIPLDIHWRRGTKNKDRDTLRWIARIAKAIDLEDKYRGQIFREHSNA